MVYFTLRGSMPTLNWIGKEKVVNHHLDVPFRVLGHQYGFTAKGKQPETTNSGNKIIHGDNLEALKALLPEYEGKVKCIYIDPPYNTGNEEWRYNDNVNDPRIRQWLHEVVGKEGEDLTRHDKWLCMMYPRLTLLRKLLAEDGTIFISIDDNELANAKLLADEIFGRGNFIEYFSWYKTYSPSNLSNKSKKCLEYVLCYEKKRSNRRYRGLFKTNEADNPLIKSNNQVKVLRFPHDAVETTLKEDVFLKAGKYGTKTNEVELLNDVWFRNGRFENDLELRSKFIWTQENLEAEISNKTKIIFKGTSLAPRYDKASYEPEVPRNLIDENDEVGTTEEGGIVLKKIFGEKVFEYPKAPSLIEYLLNFVCDKNSIILDSFGGSGTTAHAVLNLNKRDKGNRKFILIELNDYAEHITAERVKRVINGYADTEGTGGSFDFYTLGNTVFTENGELNELAGTENIRRYVWYTETRTPYQRPDSTNEYLLGLSEGTCYYFYYDPDGETVLNYSFLSTLDPSFRGEQHVFFADSCVLSEDFMLAKKIVFKKIPRDITKF